jgi:hypothetical protein
VCRLHTLASPHAPGEHAIHDFSIVFSIFLAKYHYMSRQICRWGFPKPRPRVNKVGLAPRYENGCKCKNTDALCFGFGPTSLHFTPVRSHYDLIPLCSPLILFDCVFTENLKYLYKNRTLFLESLSSCVPLIRPSALVSLARLLSPLLALVISRALLDSLLTVSSDAAVCASESNLLGSSSRLLALPHL